MNAMRVYLHCALYWTRNFLRLHLISFRIAYICCHSFFILPLLSFVDIRYGCWMVWFGYLMWYVSVTTPSRDHSTAPTPLQATVVAHSRCYPSFVVSGLYCFMSCLLEDKVTFKLGGGICTLFACKPCNLLTWIQYTPHVHNCWFASCLSESASVIVDSYCIFSDLSPPHFHIWRPKNC